MLLFALTASFVLGQEEPSPSPAPSDEAASAPAEPTPASAASEAATEAAPSAGGGPSGSADPAISALRRQTDELARTAARVKSTSGVERQALIEELRKKSQVPLVPPRDFDLDQFYLLSESEQAAVIARSFFEALISGDAGRVVEYTGLPFMLEDKKLERPDELRSTWAKHLRSKRTDLIALYGVETLSSAEMEKKYGQPPARLKNWPWRQAQQQYLAVGNLSGRAAVVILRSAGATWQVVAYHD